MAVIERKFYLNLVIASDYVFREHGSFRLLKGAMIFPVLIYYHIVSK